MQNEQLPSLFSQSLKQPVSGWCFLTQTCGEKQKKSLAVFYLLHQLFPFDAERINVNRVLYEMFFKALSPALISSYFGPFEIQK